MPSISAEMSDENEPRKEAAWRGGGMRYSEGIVFPFELPSLLFAPRSSSSSLLFCHLKLKGVNRDQARSIQESRERDDQTSICPS